MKSRYCTANVPKIRTRWVGPLVRLRRRLNRNKPDVYEIIGYCAPVFPKKNPGA